MLPKECYSSLSVKEQIESEGVNEQYNFYKIQSKFGILGEVNGKTVWSNQPELVEGILTYVENAIFPLKGIPPNPEHFFALNIIKAILIESLKIVNPLYFRSQQVLDSFNRIGYKVLSPYFLNKDYLNSFDNELYNSIIIFLNLLKFEPASCQKFATIFTHIISNDNAYRLRLKDIIGETSVKALQSPRREIKRLTGIISQRDTKSQAYKANKVLKLFNWLLLVPIVKKAFKETLRQIDLKKLKFDEGDRYWAYMRTDYLFEGKSYLDRQLYAQSKNWTYPKKRNMINPLLA